MFTGPNDTLLSGTATLSFDPPSSPTFFVLSHVCPGTEVGGDTTFGVDKTIADGSDPFPGATVFVIEVTCVPPQGSDVTGTFVFDENGDVIGAQSDDLPMQVPTGSDCTATETNNGDPDVQGCSVSTSIDGVPWEGQGDPSKTVTDVEGDVVVFENGLVCVGGQVTVGIDVEKRIVGEALPDEGSTFVVSLTCTVGGNPLTVVPASQSFVWSGDFPGAPGDTTSSVKSFTADIEQGQTPECTLEETDTGGSHLVGYYLNGVFQGDDPIQVTLTETERDLVTVENDPTIDVGGINVLPTTGADVGLLPGVGMGLIVIGSLLLLADTYRRRQLARRVTPLPIMWKG